MSRFKRNQVEEAIARTMGARTPGPQLRTKLKRLLETDRNLGRRLRSSDPEQATYAFFSEEAPGSGAEVWFSAYEAFALFTAWRLLEHGFPQTSAVAIVRRARPELERRHAQLLRLDPEVIFNPRNMPPLRAGSQPHDSTQPVFLVLASHQGDPLKAGLASSTVRVFDEREAWQFMRDEPVGVSVTHFELVRASHALQQALKATTPSKRGRSGG
jgi:hypothetical protein